VVENVGPNTLYDVSISVQEVVPGVVTDLGNAVRENLGDIRPFDLKPTTFRVRLPATNKSDLDYLIMFRARNGGFEEGLHIRRKGNEGRESFEVSSLQYPGKPSRLLRKVPFGSK